MIKHIVMWNIRGDTPEAKAAGIARLQRSFESLRGQIPGLAHLEIGVDASRVDYACDVVLYSEFDSQAALDAYASHPEHLRVKGELADLRIARTDGRCDPGGLDHPLGRWRCGEVGLDRAHDRPVGGDGRDRAPPEFLTVVRREKHALAACQTRGDEPEHEGQARSGADPAAVTAVDARPRMPPARAARGGGYRGG